MENDKHIVLNLDESVRNELSEAAKKNLDNGGRGIGYSTLTKWLKDFRESGDISVRGSGNYASDEQKEIARLRRELRDAQGALDVLKRAINILRK